MFFYNPLVLWQLIINSFFWFSGFFRVIISCGSGRVILFAFIGTWSWIYKNFLLLLFFFCLCTFWLLLRIFVLRFNMFNWIWNGCEKCRFFVRNDNLFGLITLISYLIFWVQTLIRLILINFRDLGRLIRGSIDLYSILLLSGLDVRLSQFLDSFSFQLHIDFLYKLFFN